jgi:hypothetical protein
LAQWRRVEYSGDNALINQAKPDAMSHSADALYKMSEVELLAAYAEARREFVEKKFARDTRRARLAWIRAKMFTSSSGGVTERNMAIYVSKEIARKGQEVREMTGDLDLVRVEVDIIASVIRFRGAPAPRACTTKMRVKAIRGTKAIGLVLTRMLGRTRRYSGERGSDRIAGARSVRVPDGHQAHS